VAADPESVRLAEDGDRTANWKRWGPYLPERQWGTVREDYSADGDAWRYFPFDHAHLRAYRWGEDGLMGFTDRQGRLCFSLALWNGRDPILKERLFGLNGHEGNHGEDCKELYFYLDSTPTHSYCKALYKYPQQAFPYEALRQGNARRSRSEPELELTDLGVFDEGRYFDVVIEYAKRSPEDILIRVTVTNRGPEPAELHLLPNLWFRNLWSWGRTGEAYQDRPRIYAHEGGVRAESGTLGHFGFDAETAGQWLFTDNVSNAERLWGAKNESPYTKDAFHAHVVGGEPDRVNPEGKGTKVTCWTRQTIPAGGQVVARWRLHRLREGPKEAFGPWFDEVMERRLAEADGFWSQHTPDAATPDERQVLRQAWAGLLWTKQFYHYVPKEWLEGDPNQPRPPSARLEGRNVDWARHLYNRDVISVPDKWEYPWYAAWDLAFHMIPFARFDGRFARGQLELFLREWYLHPNGQLPAYEWNLSDVNPPVHAWAAWRLYKMSGPKGARDQTFLAHAFQKLLMNFTWWVNRKDEYGRNLFTGGFLGLDNIGLFDRSRPAPAGHRLEQADGTAWMAFYCTTMLGMAMDLARYDRSYADLASKFFEHFIAIADAMNTTEDSGLWDEGDGFYYDELRVDGPSVILRIRSMVGIIPLFAVLVLEDDELSYIPSFLRRMSWFLENRPELARHISYLQGHEQHARRLLAIPTRDKLVRVLRYVLDEDELLSPYGVRSVSKIHEQTPFSLTLHGVTYSVRYVPGESDSGLFGGNSNWRGPVWLPVNLLLIEALERYHYFYGESLRVECPTGSGNWMNLQQVADEIAARLTRLFVPNQQGHRPCNGGDPRWAEDPAFRDLVQFHEYFHGDHGQGLGASHQTGWTAMIAECIRRVRR
jgi:hypothetical protein